MRPTHWTAKSGVTSPISAVFGGSRCLSEPAAIYELGDARANCTPRKRPT